MGSSFPSSARVLVAIALLVLTSIISPLNMPVNSYATKYGSHIGSGLDGEIIPGNAGTKSYHNVRPTLRLMDDENCIDSIRHIHVAVYSGPGVWYPGLEALHEYLEARGISFDDVTAMDIRKGILGNYDVLVIPGGWAYSYAIALGDKGEQEIKSFVKRGGGYLGICAGAFLASRLIVWKSNVYNYSLDIVEADAVGPKEDYIWPSSGLLKIIVTKEWGWLGLNPVTTAFYYGGPEFKNLGKGVLVLALYSDDYKPAIILSNYNLGRVALTGVHLEKRKATWPVLDLLLAYIAGCLAPRNWKGSDLANYISSYYPTAS